MRIRGMKVGVCWSGLEPGALEEAPGDRGAHGAIEGFDRITLADGDLGVEFGFDSPRRRYEGSEQRPGESALSIRWCDAERQEFAPTVGLDCTRDRQPHHHGARPRGRDDRAISDRGEDQGVRRVRVRR
jgi:hypothetical protein